MNLLLDPWIPVRRRGGGWERLAPWQITEAWERDPVVALASPRPDFDGALAQFLVGWLQSVFAPESERAWARRLDDPPTPEALRAASEPWADAFELLGDGPRFLQDLILKAAEAEELPIERLLLETPGESTVKTGKNHFVRGGSVLGLCPACAAAALLALQVNAPSGGQGHRTSIRGGGPLSTLLWSHQSLWRSLWLNVFDRPAFEQTLGGNAGLEERSARFPWLAPTRTSEKGRPDTTGEDIHPLQLFWAMPRRIRLLDPQPGEGSVPCDLCAEPSPTLLTHYLTKNLGVNYTGPFRHPLSPYRKDQSGNLFASKGNAEAMSYRQWLGLVAEDADNGREPAAVVQRLRRVRIARGEALREVRLWGFGFEMDNMKARAWCEGAVPLYWPAPERQQDFELAAGRYVLSARHAERSLLWALKMVIRSNPKDVSGSLDTFRGRFWQETEAYFWPRLEALLDTSATAGEETERKLAWRARLGRVAERIFEAFTSAEMVHAIQLRRIAGAARSLRSGLYGKDMAQILDLPVPAAPGPKRGRGKTQSK